MMTNILKQITATRIQVIFSSSTNSDHILNMAESMVTDPVRILLRKEDLGLNWIKQYFVKAETKECKLKKLLDFFCGADMGGQTLIFCNRKLTVDWLIERLEYRNYNLRDCAIHGDMTQTRREYIMKEFTANRTQILITSDLLHRGIDIKQISHVINFDLPDSYSTYIHRIGRCGRYGREGTAITFVETSQMKYLKKYQRLNNTRIDEMCINNCMPATSWINLFLAAIICKTRESVINWAEISRLMESKMFMTLPMDAKRCEDVFNRLVGLYVDVLSTANSINEASKWFVYFNVFNQIDWFRTGINDTLICTINDLWHRLLHNTWNQ